MPADDLHGTDRPILRLAAYTDADLTERLRAWGRDGSPAARAFWDAQFDHTHTPADRDALVEFIEQLAAGAA